VLVVCDPFMPVNSVLAVGVAIVLGFELCRCYPEFNGSAIVTSRAKLRYRNEDCCEDDQASLACHSRFHVYE